MVEGLLRAFVHEDWLTLIDFSTLEKQGGSYVTDDLREREDGIIGAGDQCRGRVGAPRNPGCRPGGTAPDPQSAQRVCGVRAPRACGGH